MSNLIQSDIPSVTVRYISKISKVTYTIYTCFVYTIHTILGYFANSIEISIFFIRIKIGVFYARR